jgi:single-strand DNA-binding protein
MQCLAATPVIPTLSTKTKKKEEEEGKNTMSKSVNRVQLLGNLGKDPEVRYTSAGTPVAQLSLATSYRVKGNDGNFEDRTEWHIVVLWNRLAEIAGEYLKKGSKVYIDGRNQTRSWDDKTTGQKVYRTEVIANELVLCGGNGGNGNISIPTNDGTAESGEGDQFTGAETQDIPF